jgi:hypothetical protein
MTCDAVTSDQLPALGLPFSVEVFTRLLVVPRMI